MPKVVLVTGMQAAGKSTIAPLLAARLGPPAATLDGDVFYRGVVAGAEIMTPDPSAEAVRQLQLRYDASALVAQHYADAGFDFVCSDIILGRGRRALVRPAARRRAVPGGADPVRRVDRRAGDGARRQQLLPRLARLVRQPRRTPSEPCRQASTTRRAGASGSTRPVRPRSRRSTRSSPTCAKARW